MAKFEVSQGRWLEVETFRGAFYLKALKDYDGDIGVTTMIEIPRALAPQVVNALGPELINLISWLLELAQTHGLVDADDEMACKAQAYIDLATEGSR